MKSLTALFMFAVLPVYAADIVCKTGVPLDELIDMLESKGGGLISLTDIPGADGFDQILIAENVGEVAVGLVFRGCVITSPMRLGSMKPEKPKVGV